MQEKEYQYWAFISYSSKDSDVCKKLHKALENYKVPSPLVGKESRGEPIPAKIFPVFRDREEFPLNANLGSSIENALALSRYLIVLCSKKSAKSIWVNEEVRYFKSLGREDRVLAIIVDGEPNASNDAENSKEECFPPALRFHVDEKGQITDIRKEPIAGDIRPSGDGWNKTFLKCVAGILGVGLDEIIQRDKVARKRRRFFQSVTAVVSLVILSSLSLGYFSAKEDAVLSQKVSENLKNSILCEGVEHSDLANAVVVGDIKQAKKALENGDNVNEQTCSHQTSILHKAVMAGHTHVVRWLLESGADTSLVDKSGYLPLHYVSLYGHSELVDEFKKVGFPLNEPVKILSGAYKTALLLAIEVRQIEVVKKLVELGVPVVLPEHEKYQNIFVSGLTVAAARNSPEVTLYLLEKGADPYFQENISNSTPRSIAENNASNDVIRIFDDFDKKNNIVHTKQELSLSLARVSGNYSGINTIDLDIVKSLLDKGANPFLKGDKPPKMPAVVKAFSILSTACKPGYSNNEEKCEHYVKLLTLFSQELNQHQDWKQSSKKFYSVYVSKSSEINRQKMAEAGFNFE